MDQDIRRISDGRVGGNSVEMLADAIVEVAKRAVEAADGINGINGTDIAFGEVVQENPLEVMLEQRLLLPAEVLVLTEAVIGEAVRLEGEDYPEYAGRKVYAVRHNLSLGDKVLMMRAAGGQMWVVLSRYYATA